VHDKLIAFGVTIGVCLSSVPSWCMDVLTMCCGAEEVMRQIVSRSPRCTSPM